MNVLEIRGVSKRFGGLVALDNVSFEVKENVIHGLIGPNGAGKSTLFKSIAGFDAPSRGAIYYRGENVAGKSPSEIARSGIVRTFQETTLFQEMSVFENVLVGCHIHARSNVFSAILGSDKRRQLNARRKAMEALDFMGLTGRSEQLAGELPLGLQRSLAIAVALAAEPRVLLMDEPFAGMNPQETNRMMELTKKIQQSGMTIVLVDHDMKAVMGLCDYLTVLNFGQLLAEGAPDEVRSNERVIEAYLGEAS